MAGRANKKLWGVGEFIAYYSLLDLRNLTVAFSATSHVTCPTWNLIYFRNMFTIKLILEAEIVETTFSFLNFQTVP